MAYRAFEVSRIAGALGAEIHGIDLAGPLGDATVTEIRQALLDHLVIFFHDQRLSPEQHLAFGRRFGDLQIHDYVEGKPDYPEILEVRKEEHETGSNFGGAWHSDVTYLEEPALGSILYARKVPAFGGDTLFANMYLAYDTLSEGMKRMLEGMTAVHSARRAYGLRSSYFAGGQRSMKIRRSNAAEREVEHPVVRTHPETGRKALFVNGTFTIRFTGMTEQDSAPLLEYLDRHATRPEFTCRFRWRRNAIAFWDNRCLQHYAINDYDGQRRVMHRVTVNGDRPH
jgi:taurine dioxygenase